MTHLALEGVGFVYPDGTRALSRRRPGDRAGRGRRHRRPERQREVDARPPPRRPPPADRRARAARRASTSPGSRVAALAASVGIVFQNPDRQIFAGRVRTEVEFGPRILGRVGPRRGQRGHGGPADGRARRPCRCQSVRPRVLEAEAPDARLGPGHGDTGRRPRRADDRPGRPRRRADPGGRRGGRRGRADRDRDQPRHALRGRDRSGGSSSWAPAGSCSTARRPRSSASRPGRSLASTYLEPPLAARVGARLGLGATPTESSLVEALAGQGLADSGRQAIANGPFVTWRGARERAG